MALPATPLLDSFSRPNESPLFWDGAWLPLDTALLANMRVNNNAVGQADVQFNYRYWTPGDTFLDSEVWIETISVTSFRLLLRLSSLGGTTAVDGYMGTVTNSQVAIEELNNAARTTISSIVANTTAAGDRYVFRAVGNLLTLYRVRSGAVLLLVSCPMVTIHPAGRLGLGQNGSTGQSYRNFGGGSLTDPQVPAEHPVGGFGAM